MSRNRRQFLGALGATGVVSAIATAQVDAQAPQPATASTKARIDRELSGKVAIVTDARNILGRGFAVALP